MLAEVAATNRRSQSPVPVAVIDVGTTSIRMAIAEIQPSGNVRPLTTLSQAVSLGKSTFARGVIEKSAIEECVRVLRSYKRILAEHHIDRPEQWRCVATSAVREALNRLAFIDRVYLATGIAISPIDEAEVNRLTYLGVQPVLRANPELEGKTTLVAEVGGGSTELLLVRQTEVLFAHSYRLGSLRLRQQLETYRAPQSQTRRIMETQIRRQMEQILSQIPAETANQLLALGGDVRFAAKQIHPEWNMGELVTLPLSKLEQLTDAVLSLTDDKLVHKYHISFHDAGSLGPALLGYVQLCRAFELSELLVANVGLRDGLLLEMASGGAWNADFADQVFRSALVLARRFEIDEAHGRQVAKLSKILFQSLQEEHGLEPRYELLLAVAALLHEIGQFVSIAAYHKHTMYLINNSELFGLSKADLQLVALTARYHRKSVPKPTHPAYADLDRDHRIAVAKMAALLRLADALDAAHAQRLHELTLTKESGRLVISVPHVDDLSLEQLALRQSGSLFEDTFGMPVLLRQLRPGGRY
jgi:exopolyphosphatase / guanosine-5'-triphosphate,3'-diphosphate pyrophosphatase